MLSRDAVLHDIHVDAATDVARRFPDRKRADGRYYALDLTLAPAAVGPARAARGQWPTDRELLRALAASKTK